MNDVHFHKLSMLMYFMFVLCISVIVLFTFRITTLRTNQIDAQIRSEILKQPELIQAPAPAPEPVIEPIPDSTFEEFLELNPTLARPSRMRDK